MFLHLGLGLYRGLGFFLGIGLRFGGVCLRPSLGLGVIRPGV